MWFNMHVPHCFQLQKCSLPDIILCMYINHWAMNHARKMQVCELSFGPVINKASDLWIALIEWAVNRTYCTPRATVDICMYIHQTARSAILATLYIFASPNTVDMFQYIGINYSTVFIPLHKIHQSCFFFINLWSGQASNILVSSLWCVHVHE